MTTSAPAQPPRDHGGGLDAAAARFGGTRAEWLDLSTGINPVPYPLPPLPADAWTALPDRAAFDRLERAARRFWQVPDSATVIAAPGASALIARLPSLARPGTVYIPAPTYNEHHAAFAAAPGWTPGSDASLAPEATAHVYVHPNNPDGHLWSATHITDRPLTVIDESFADVTPAQSLVAEATRPGVVVLKSFGKFWGLAGLRLGFAIAAPETLAGPKGGAGMGDMLGPWAVSGPALTVGATALEDHGWAEDTRRRLAQDAVRLDALMRNAGASVVGGTDLFRLYDVNDAAAWQDRLARHRIWSRVFPYSRRWLRLGLPAPDGWPRLEAALR